MAITTAKAPKLPKDLAAFRASYAKTFGLVPPIPDERIALGAALAPEFTRQAEKIRALALYSKVFDNKTAQLVAFALLLADGNPAAYRHALAARRFGASWAELHKIIEICFVIAGGMSCLNPGGQMLARLRREETMRQEKKSKRGRSKVQGPTA